MQNAFVLDRSSHLSVWALAILYLAHGLPGGLLAATIVPWISASGAEPGQVARLIALLTLPWGFKFLIAAAMDRYQYRPMGRRRPWIILSNALIALALAVAAAIDPDPGQIMLIGAIGFMIALGSASLDTAADGLAVQVLTEDNRASASSFMYGGQAVGLSIGAAGGGLLLATIGSAPTFAVFAGIAALITSGSVLVRERNGDKLLPWNVSTIAPNGPAENYPGWSALAKELLASVVKRGSLVLLAASVFFGLISGTFTAFWPIFATQEAGFEAADYGQLLGVLIAVAALVAMPVSHTLMRKFGAANATIISLTSYLVIALAVFAAPVAAQDQQFFLALTIFWLLGELLVSICLNPLRLAVSSDLVGATQFTTYTSAISIAKSAGGLVVAYTYGQGDLALLMVCLFAMIAICGAIIAQMR